ncbi:hypothetical protein C8F01DRAFT_291709 [Mycena amicta]|nr:hypothetical protein C8F01DRAFT_291709 [Mycena amicta]
MPSMPTQSPMSSHSEPAGGLTTLPPSKASLSYILGSPAPVKASRQGRKRLADLLTQEQQPESAPAQASFVVSPTSPSGSAPVLSAPITPTSAVQGSSPTDSVFSHLAGDRYLSEDNGLGDRLFERPASSPEVSPQTLPPLCNEDDSDDEAFVESGEFYEYEAGSYESDYEEEQEPYIGSFPPDAVRAAEEAAYQADADNFWNSRLTDYLATATQDAYEAPMSFTFTFVAPYGAPAFPSVAEAAKRIGRVSVVFVPVPTMAAVHQGLVHERPSDESFFEPTLVDYQYDSFGPYDLHRAILDRSCAPDPHSYAQAPPATQALVRQLALEYPQIRPDMLTPVEQVPSEAVWVGNYPYACPLPSCEDNILPTLHAAQTHVKQFHAPANSDGRLPCPVPGCRDCDSEYTALEFAGHLHRSHRIEPARARSCLQCKLCGDRCVGGQLYATHATQCARGRSPETFERPHKRARVAA